MNIPQSKIEKAASENSSRFPLTQVYFDKDKGVLVAADGFMMAVVPVDEVQDNDLSGLVDPDAIKLARKRGNGQLVLGEKQVTALDTGWSINREQENYPDHEQIFKQCKTDADKAVPVLVLDADRLHRLAQAICPNSQIGLGVRIFLPHRVGNAIEVRPETKNGARGVLMPMDHKDSERADLRPLVRALESDGEITSGMRVTLKGLLGLG